MDKKFDRTVAIVGGSFKPPHQAHLYLVQEYAKMADEVVVLISDPKSAKSIRKTCLGTVITPEMSKKIWEIYLKRYGLRNVDVRISAAPSPISALFKYVDDNLNDVNVIFGVSKKGGDESRFKSAMKYYADNDHINLLDPIETAVEPFVGKSGKAVSATDIRDNIDKPDVVKEMLPDKLTDEDVKEVISILSNGKVAEADFDEIGIPQKKTSFDKTGIDEDEEAALVITDEALKQSRILCYNVGQQSTDARGKVVPVNPKKFPEKAIDIKFMADGHQVEIWLDSESKEWMSKVDEFSRLSLEQYGQFFSTQFYIKLAKKLISNWPMSDKLYGSLFVGVAEKRVSTSNIPMLPEDEEADKERNDRIEQKRKDREESKEKRYSASGRKLIKFGDMGVIMSSARFFCWPDEDKVYRWSTWKDWKKIKPLCRLRFKHTNGKEYGMSLSCIGDMYEHRGFRGYDLTTQPTLQWLSKEEMEDFIKLSVVQKFINHCVTKITNALELDTDEIYKKINNPDKITKVEIDKTKDKVRKTLMYIIKKKQLDDFVWK